MREEHYAVLQALVDEFYDHFRGLVVERRGPAHVKADSPAASRLLDMARIESLTDGRVVTGVRAAEAGLVDQTGGLRDAFEVAKQLAGVQAGKLVKYYREDSDPPRTAYSRSETAPAQAAGEINLLQLRLGTSAAPDPGVYYLWEPPG
jgi:ClpP class serine protease